MVTSPYTHTLTKDKNMHINSKKSKANQTLKAACDCGQKLAEYNLGCVCIVKTSTGYGVIARHPYDVRLAGWNVVKVYMYGVEEI